jgi:beta-lactamase regulating signal transducer with metallopeptidase domain
MTAMGWMLHTAVGGGLLLLGCWVVMRRVSSPARRQRLGEWGVLAALLLAGLSLGPAWLPVPLLKAAPQPAPAVAQPAPPPPELPPAEEPLPEMEPGDALLMVPDPPGADALADALPRHGDLPPEHPRVILPSPTPAATPEPAARSAPSLSQVLLAAYGVGVAVLLARLLVGYVALYRLLRRAVPAPAAAVRLLQELRPRCRVRLLVSRRARVPFSCGLVRPAIVVPAFLCAGGPSPALRWVLAHEAAHLERRDAWAGLLLGLGQALYFFLPWFWWLRRQVRLCQEYLADAAAARAGTAVDYAQFLVGWIEAPAPPLGCTGVSGSSSDLYRRITMLLHSSGPLEGRCPRPWSLAAAVGLLALAVLLAGLGLGVQAAPSPSEPRKDEPKQEEPKKKKTRKEQGASPALPDLEDMLKGLQGKLDPEKLKELQKQLEQNRQEIEKALRQLQELGQPLGGMQGPLMLWGLKHDGRLGVHVSRPSPALADQLDLPPDQGLVIDQVLPRTPADKAGLKPHDVLLEVGGKRVPGTVEGLLRQLAQIKADQPVDVVVLRKGKKETIRGLKLAPAAPVRREANWNPFTPGTDFKALGDFKGFGQGAGNMNFGGFVTPGLGNKGVLTTTFRSADRFTTRHQEGSLVITLTGKVADGKATLGEIRIQDGGELHKYESIDQVPERYRDKVKNLIEMSEKSGVKIDVKTS